ncbi:TetR family transcriptional regulator [Myxococcus stipitatus DSM 14675]|uniref:TetR family transcriptional regulator n=1 Tax=Myxococcus stipitatus (strain DSM 14675 / JCM 12634 / Mx s8) TaxID=1278073 RepID=L7ULN9_MYXSD|nr:TetR/AcrR family transcriptional regulator [Myxococcus stipitatus]AGC48830.1 TetR family transcriptional regulator [Myxococcus stipitatus DSM 14675]
MPRPKTRPRKTPRQERSRAMVETLLDATIRVLLARGYDGMTTIAVAERAGVSVGSLYQYFPNKESLVATLAERHTAELLACVDEAFSRADPSDPESGIRALVRAGVDAHRIAPALHKVLLEQVPRIGRMAKVMETSREIVARLERFLLSHRERLIVPDAKVAAFVVETIVESLTHRLVIEQPDYIDAARLEEETTRLAMGYLFGPRVRPRARQ